MDGLVGAGGGVGAVALIYAIIKLIQVVKGNGNGKKPGSDDGIIGHEDMREMLEVLRAINTNTKTIAESQKELAAEVRASNRDLTILLERTARA